MDRHATYFTRGPSIWNFSVLFNNKQQRHAPYHAEPVVENGRQLMEKAFNKTKVRDYIVSYTEDKVVISYPPFTVSEPHFISEEDRKFFWSNKLNTEVAHITGKNHLTGVIKLIKGAVYAPNIDCGWGSKLQNFEAFTNWGDERTPSDRVVYFPLLVPESDSFQHFLDGTVPKLIQALPFLLQKNVQLVIYTYGTNPIIPAILRRLGLKKNAVKLYNLSDRRSNKVVEVDYELNGCIAPPMHPLLSQTFHTAIGAPWNLTIPLKDSLVILLSRHLAHNSGRHILNHPEVITFMKDRYGDRFHSFHGVYDLQRAFSVFGKARMIIGVHGGAFYNLNFSPRQTTIVEVMPVWGDEYPKLAHSIVWRMADALGQQYWRINQQADDSFCNVKLDVNKLKLILDRIDEGL